MVNKLMRKIEKLEAETLAKQTNLEQLRREKIELENTLEQEQESLVNRLWKRMERLEAEKRMLQEKLDQPVSAPVSPRAIMNSARLSNAIGVGGGNSSSNSSIMLGFLSNNSVSSGYASNASSLSSTNNSVNATNNNNNNPTIMLNAETTAQNLTEHIINLRREVSRLKTCLEKAEREHKENMAKLVKEEKEIRDENLRLQRRLQMEVDRREQLCRHLSESESSLEMDDERHFNESTRVRTISSPLPGVLNTQQQQQQQAQVQHHVPPPPPPSIQQQQQLLAPIATTLSSSSLNNQQDKCPYCNHSIKTSINNSSSNNKNLSTKSTSTSTLSTKSQQQMTNIK